MNNSQLKFIDQIRNNKKIAFLSFLVFLAAIVIIVAGVRLLVGDKNEKLGERELKLVDSLQESFGAFPREIILLEGGAVQSRAVLNNIKQTIENDWAKLKKVSYLSSESVAEVDQVITSLQSYLNSQMIGQPVVERPLPVAREAFILTQGIRNEIVAYANKPRTNIELPVIIGAVSVLIISMFLIAVLFWVDFVRRFKFTQEEKESDQAAILRLLDELVDLADGDLTISATVSEDFTGAIADSINFTIDQLRQLVSRINSTAVQVSQAAQSTQQTALHLAEASDHQAQEIAGASAAINEMAVTIDQVSANASESALVAGKSVSIANNGAKLVQNTIHGMDTIREQIQDTSKRIKRLGESSQEIGDIVSLINDIADQTNILALNAAIQASMAGDAGRGFAVVADEVQRLAERSAAATKQIESLVKTIQSDTNEAVISMEQTTSEVVRGARLAQDAGVALEEIEGVSANLAELIQNISNAARQQASSAGHISNTMNVIQEITSQTSAGTGATAKSIGDLANMALDLRESVAGFTLPSEMIADLEHEQKQVRTKTATAMPPTLKNSIRSSGKTTTSMEDLLEELELNEEDMAQSGDFFELLAGDDEDDLLSEFDVDLSDIEFPDNDKKSVG
jgi:twitching motility protein PilJ